MLDSSRLQALWTFPFVAALAAYGCAAGDTSETDDPTTTSAATGGTGGTGGATDGGSAGSTDSCSEDCATIVTPTCFVSVCNEGMHAGPVGQCVVVPDVDGSACDDGLFCTTDDSCQAGMCTGGPPNDCGMDAPQCQAIVCDEDSDGCTTEPADAGAVCVHTDLCLLGTTCQNGQCAGGMLNDCFFAPVPDECHVAVCNPINGMCEPVAGNDGDPCLDSTDPCTVNKTCDMGACQGGNPKDCSQLTMGCNIGVCDTTNGMCVAQTVMNGQICDDLDACTTGETCSNGNCGSGAPVTTCSQTGDGCCPSSCTALNDIDCACMTTGFTTTFINTSGWDGFMFDVVALEAIEIKTFDVNIDPGMKTIEIYYKTGTHAGFESTSTAWTLVGGASVNPSAPNIGTPVPISVDVPIPQGQTYAFYITSTALGTLNNGVNYILSIPTGSVQAQDTNVQLLGGKGKGYPFAGSTFVDRGFSGTVYYEKCGQ
jgi:hypothetical protein